MNEAVITHLEIADRRMRELFGYYWHQRGYGINESQVNLLAREIKKGERLLKRLKKLRKDKK